MLVKNLLYILQSLNYETRPFLKYVCRHPAWWKSAQRGRLVWTAKSASLFIASLIMFLVILLTLFFYFRLPVIFIFLLIFILPPFCLILANILLKPLDYFLKQKRIVRAEKILKNLSLTTIGLTGSYGKTSAKEILKAILSEKYSVVSTPENVNTDIGIANFIIKHETELAGSNIFIVEMGAYRVGEIARICDFVKPDYSILTGVNEAHLEKFGRLDYTIKAKFELPQRTKKFSFLNFSDANIKTNYQKFSLNNFAGLDGTGAKNLKFLDNFSGLKFEYENLKFSTSLLAEHNIILILLARQLAKKLGLDDQAIIAGVKKIRPLKHRLELIRNQATGLTIIDDSYNGNFNGLISGLKVLGRAKGRKIVLTPGLVEQGKAAARIHQKIGRLYAKISDLVLLINNNSTKQIVDALKQENFINYKIYPTTQAAHDDLKNVLRPGDTIIFQNDWPEAYF